MHFKAIFSSVLLLILFTSFAGKKSNVVFAKAKNVGIYDRDSLLNEVPRFLAMKEAAAAEKRELDSIHVALYDRLADYRNNFYKDSAKMSPMIKALKFQEIQEMRINIAQFSQYANEQVKGRYEMINHDFNNIFTLTALRVQKQKGLDTVLDKKQLIEYKNLNSPVKTKNVTKEMRADLDIK